MKSLRSLWIPTVVLSVMMMSCACPAQEIITADDDDKPVEKTKPKVKRDRKTLPAGIDLEHASEGATTEERLLLKKLHDALDAKVKAEGDEETRRQAVMDKLNHAQKLCDEYLKGFPKGTCVGEVRFRKSWLYHQSYRYGGKREYRDQAMDMAGKLIEDMPGNVWTCKARILRMQLLRAQGKFVEAIAEAEAVVKDFPDNALAPETQYYVYDMQRRRKKLAEAEAALKLLVEKYPENDWGRKAAGMLKRSTLTGQPLDIDFIKADETTFKLSEHRGKAVLVIYWSSGSAPSMQFHKQLKVLHKLYSADGLVMIGVNLNPGKESFDEAQAKLGAPWVQCFDGEAFLSPMATAVGVTAIPSTVLLDRQGRVRAMDLQGRRLRQAIVDVLGRR